MTRHGCKLAKGTDKMSVSFQGFGMVHSHLINYTQQREKNLSIGHPGCTPFSDNRENRQPQRPPPFSKAVLSERFGPAGFNHCFKKEL